MLRSVHGDPGLERVPCHVGRPAGSRVRLGFIIASARRISPRSFIYHFAVKALLPLVESHSTTCRKWLSLGNHYLRRISVPTTAGRSRGRQGVRSGAQRAVGEHLSKVMTALITGLVVSVFALVMTEQGQGIHAPTQP